MSIQKTFSDYRDDVLNEISNQIKNELGDDFPPEKELVYLAKTAFSNAIHIAYISREYANESHNEQLAKSLAGDGSDIIEYFHSFIRMGVCLDRIDQWKEIIKSWPIKDAPIRFYGKGGNSNLGIALDFSQWVRDLCLTDGAGQMGMDKSIVLTPQYNKTAEDFYKLAMRKLNENLPSELEWSKSRIGQESGCVQGSIETELKAYQPPKPKSQAEESKKKTKNRPTKKEKKNRASAILIAAIELAREFNNRIPTVKEVVERTGYPAKQIYDSEPYKEGKIARESAILTQDSTDEASVTGSEYYNRHSIERSRADRKHKNDQDSIDDKIDSDD